MNRFFLTELRRSMRSARLAVLILVLSFLRPLLADILRTSVETFLQQNSRRILTADLAVSAYRPIRDEEVDRLRAKFPVRKEVREVEFVTMSSTVPGGAAQASAKDGDRSALIEVHAVEPTFPIEGEFELPDGGKARGAPSAGSVWLSDEARVALGLELGGTVHIGKSEFRVEKVFTLAPGVSRAAFGFAPRAYIALNEAEKTGLMGFGSQVNYRVYLEFEKVPTSEAATEALGDPDLFLRTPDDSIQGLERFTGYVSLYLSVVAVALFALGWAAAFYILRTQAIERMRTAAIAMVFGARAESVLRFEFARAAVMTLLAALIALILAFTGAKILEPSVAAAISRNVAGSVFTVALSLKEVFGLFITALASALIFTIPFAMRLRSSRLVSLFADSPVQSAGGAQEENEERKENRLAVFGTAGLAALTLTFLAVWLTRDLKRGSQLAVGFLAATLIIHLMGIFVFKTVAQMFAKAKGTSGSLLRLAGIQLSRARFAVRLSFLAIGLSAFVASTVGQIMVSLAQELGTGASIENAPDFFAFNIPESELDHLKAKVQEKSATLGFLSPMILARLKTNNGDPIKSEQFEKFPVRITWRETTIGSEQVVSGEKLPERFDEARDGLPLLSVEARFAERNGFKIGDKLGFDVQGVPVEGKVHNLRRVRWTDFNPNFFISFQAGVLEDAPKTWLANIQLPKASRAVTGARAQFQTEVVREFPDLSLIDVGQTLGRLVGLIQAILQPAEMAALLSGAFSILVLLAIVTHSTRLRAHEMNLFRILGAEPRRVRTLYRIEYGLAASLGSFLGAVLGLGLAALVSIKFLDLPFAADWPRLGITVLIGILLGLGLGDWLYRRVAEGVGVPLGNGKRVV